MGETGAYTGKRDFLVDEFVALIRTFTGDRGERLPDQAAYFNCPRNSGGLVNLY